MVNEPQLRQVLTYSNKCFPFNVFHIQPPQRQILHLHWHEELEIIRILRGTGDFFIGAEAITASAGDLLIVNKGLIHTGYSDKYEEIEYKAIVFHPSIVASSALDSYHSHIMDPYITGTLLFPNHISPSDSNYDLLRRIVDDIISEHEEQYAGFELAIKSLLLLMCVHLDRHTPTIEKHKSRQKLNIESNENFKHLISYIETNYADRLTVEQAASIVKLSTYHFCRTFKRMTGNTFVNYLNLYRINKAEQMLHESDESVTNISQMVGFSNINYFSQLFKKYKGVSPSQSRGTADHEKPRLD